MKLSTTFKTLAGVGALTIALSAIPAGAAVTTVGAAGGTKLAAGKARCDAAITASKHLTDADRSALSANVNSTRDGLTALKTQIDADSTAATLKADCALIVTQYRVYKLVAPRVHLVNGADAALAAVDVFNSANTKLTAAIASAPSRGVDPTKITDAQAKQNDMNAKTTDASTQATPVIANLVALNPADITSGTGTNPTITASRATLQTVHGDLVTAREDLRAAIADVK
jgi:predicted secreted protein